MRKPKQKQTPPHRSLPPGTEVELPGLWKMVRMGAVYGAAMGIVAGFLYLATLDTAQEPGIVLWRNFVVVGGMLGMVAGLILRLVRNFRPFSSNHS